MTRKEALQDLLATVKAGKPLQAIDSSEVWPTTYDKSTGENKLPWNDACTASQGSLDAAKALHDAVLPGWDWRVEDNVEGYVAHIGPAREKFTTSIVAVNFDCPARAWLIAILKALIAQEEEA